jgi:hypothetical protein
MRINNLPDDDSPGSQDFVKLEYVPRGDLFDLNSYELIVDSSYANLPEWWKENEAEYKDKAIQSSQRYLTKLFGCRCVHFENDINLFSVQTIGDNATITCDGYMDLHNILKIGDNVTISGSGVYFREIKSIGNNVTIEGKSGVRMKFSNLITIGDNVTITNDSDVFFPSIETIGNNVRIKSGDGILFNAMFKIHAGMTIQHIGTLGLKTNKH